jgi:tight adherence protein B
MGKKEKYEEYNGLFHNGTDYAVYHMDRKEIVIGALAGGLAGGIVVMIFFGLWFLTILSIPLCAIAGIVIYKNMLLNKRRSRLVVQFRDMLESVSSSLGSGRNVKDAFIGAYTDMQAQFGENAEIVDELHIIKSGIASNINMEVLLQDFARRSHDENVQNFADVFSVANRRGGNIRQIIFETKDVISEKIMVEQDIQTVISGKKNELNIMMVLPLIVVNQTKAMQGGASEDIVFNLLVKLAAFAMFIAAYIIGRKMMKIEV